MARCSDYIYNLNFKDFRMWKCFKLIDKKNRSYYLKGSFINYGGWQIIQRDITFFNT